MFCSAKTVAIPKKGADAESERYVLRRASTEPQADPAGFGETR